MMRGRGNWWRILLGLAFALAMSAPATASATTGSIEGLNIAPDLTSASVSSLDVSYDECTAEVPDCTWTATAMLAPPQRGYCSPAWSVFLEALGNPPGLSDPPPGSYRERQIWSMGFSGNGVRSSGPLTFALEGVNDFRLCLYATHFSAPPIYPPVEPPNLIAERLLHVDQPLKAPSILLPDVEMGVSSKTVPSRLPRSRPVPIALQLGFTSEVPSTHTAPELTRIAIDVSRNVDFQTAGLPSCPIAKLYASAASARRACAGSLVGQGVVDSEVTPPGQPTVAIAGHLLAFYGFAEGRPRILAQVTSGGALPLTYVIPFQIEKAHGAFGTSLVVRKMRQLQGQCQRAHPNCFAEPYALKGAYGHISKLDLSLNRRFTHAGRRDSFVSATCPARRRQSDASSQFEVSLRYDLGSSPGGESATLFRRCKVAN